MFFFWKTCFANRGFLGLFVKENVSILEPHVGSWKNGILMLGPWAQGPVPRTFLLGPGPGPGPLAFLLTRQVAWVALAEQVSSVELEGSI